MYSFGIEHDSGRWLVRRLDQAEVDEVAHDLRMYSRARRNIFEAEKVASGL